MLSGRIPAKPGRIKLPSILLSLSVSCMLVLAVPRHASGRGDEAERPRHQHRPTAGPNIIYILADDAGYGDFGCYGQKDIRTPNIDRMAREGMRFTDHYAGAPVCAPSRCSLLTGLHTGHAYIRGNREVLPEGQMALAKGIRTTANVLHEAGLETAVIGKWGLGGPGSEGEPNKRGFGHWFGYLCQREAHNYYPGHLWRNGMKVEYHGRAYSHDLFTEEAVDYIRKNAGRPFFLYLAYTIPHAELQVPDLGEYAGRDWPLNKKRYAAMLTRLDAHIGRILDLLAELGLDKKTLVLFSSDNGPHAEGGADPGYFRSAGPLRGKKRDLYEGGIRVPFIARWPGTVKAGTVSRHVSAFWDMLPTLAELSGVKTPDGLDGISMAPELLGRPDRQRAHDSLYWEFHEQGGKQALRMGDWKAVRLDVRLEPDSPLELYNLADDIGETRNRAEERPEIAARMAEMMRGARSDSPEFPLIGTLDYGIGLFNGWIFSLIVMAAWTLTALTGGKAAWTESREIWRSARSAHRIIMAASALAKAGLFAFPLWLPLWFGTPRLDYGIIISSVSLAGYVLSRLRILRYRRLDSFIHEVILRFSRNADTLFFHLFWVGVAVATASGVLLALAAVSLVLRHFAILARERFYLNYYGAEMYSHYMKSRARYFVFF